MNTIADYLLTASKGWTVVVLVHYTSLQAATAVF